MNTALWTLLWLNFRAFLRKIGRQLRSARGIIFFIIGIGMLSAWILSSVFLNRNVPPADPQAILQLAPPVFLLLCVMNLFTSAGDRAVTFSPAEVDFLFPGPFTRRSLLIYKLTKTGLGSIISALIFGVVLNRFGGSIFYRATAIWLMFQLIQLLAMVLALLQAIVGERIIATGRWWILILLFLVLAAAMVEGFHHHHALNAGALSEARNTPAGRVVLAPFSVFAHIMVAQTFFPEFCKWVAIAAAIDLTLAGVVVGLDANYLEASATVSARRYDRLSRFRRSGLSAMAKPSGARWKIPMPVWAGGIGPLVWRQLTTVLRTARNLMIFLGISAVGMGAGLTQFPDKAASIGFLVGISIYVNLFLSQMLKFDFRGDLDRLDVLRSLPLRPVAIAVGQLVAPALVLATMQLLLLGAVAAFGKFPNHILILMAVFIPPLNLLTVAIDNLMFLLFPVRPTAAVAGDMGLIGRQTIVFACRSLTLLVVAAVCAGMGAVPWFILHSLPAAAVAAWFPMIAAIGLIVWLIAVTFEKFDPSISTPA